MLGQFVQIFDSEDPLRSDTTLLIAALLTLGIPPMEPGFFHTAREAVRGELKTQAIWTLHHQSPDRRFSARLMEAAWDNAAWLSTNPTHPLAILRGAITWHRAFNSSPRFSLDELRRIETPDTWAEAGVRNLIYLLRQLPCADPRRIVRFGPTWAAFVPASLSESKKTRLLKYVESPSKRGQL
jgi:hypothetical protein